MIEKDGLNHEKEYGDGGNRRELDRNFRGYDGDTEARALPGLRRQLIAILRSESEKG